MAEVQIAPQQDNVFQLPGFTNPSPQYVTQLVKEKGCLHRWAGVNVAKLSADVVVKFGAHVCFQEAEQMLYVARFTKNLPIPRVYGYYRYGPLPRDPEDEGSLYDTYLFMSLIEGETLDKVWNSYDTSTKAGIALQLRSHLEELRSIPSESFIGSVPHGVVTDPILERAPHRGPFKSESDFNHALIDAYQRRTPKLHTKNFLAGMLNGREHRLIFTHGDLRPGNIIVKDGVVSGLVDWEFSGWFPEYWEFARAFYTWRWQNDWTDYLLKILKPYYTEFGIYTFLADGIL